MKFFLLVLSFYCFSQEKEVIFIDSESNFPIQGIQIFTDRGNFIGSSDINGSLFINTKSLQDFNINSIYTFNDKYSTRIFQINNLPFKCSLSLRKEISLDEVIVSKKTNKEDVVLKGFFRSWQLVNNKLVKYGDGVIYYKIPNNEEINDFNTGIKKFIENYRTFKIDSIKSKSKIISFRGLDDYLSVDIPIRNIIERLSNIYSVKKINDYYSDVYEGDSKIGFVKYNDNFPTELNIKHNFEDNEKIKILFWKFSGSYNNIEKWRQLNDKKYLKYLFYNSKNIKIDKEKKEINIETTTEIFIDDTIYEIKELPKIFKSKLDKDKSFYSSNYWENLTMKNPLPEYIKNQLININENKNIFK